MLDAILTQRKVGIKAKIATKTLVSVGLVVLAVCLPQFVHFVAGAAGGVTWLPMYLPVLIGGCLLGTYWGLAVGIASPIASYIITSIVSNPMPALERLPFMIVELAVFAVVAGLFSKKITKNAWIAFPAVLFAQVAGRLSFILLVAIFGAATNLTVSMVWSQIQTGLIGLVLQALIVLLIIMALSNLMKKEKTNE